MKKIIFFSLLAIILVSCDGCDPINPPEPPPVVVVDSFTVKGIAHENGSVSPFEQKVEKDKFATFNIKANPGYDIDYLMNDGNKLPAIDIFTFRNVAHDDSFEVYFKKNEIVYTLLSHIWQQDSLFLFEHGQWEDWSNNTDLESNLHFLSNGKGWRIWVGKTLTVDWSIDKTTSPVTLIYNGRKMTIEALTDDKMIIYYTNQQGIIYRYIYHSSKTIKPE